jgi:hypothetical protein
VDKNGWGHTSATFHPAPNKQTEGIHAYMLRSDQFVFLDIEGETPQEFDRRELTSSLQLYLTLKEALHDPLVWPLLESLNTSQPLLIRLATGNGWFDLQPNRQDFGPLPANDRLILAGKEPPPSNPFAELSEGVIDAGWMGIMEEFNAALIQYTPPHFKTIHCKLTEGLEQGQRALFYDIQCPEFPNERSDTPNERLHRAATRVYQHLNAEHRAFPGALVKLNAQPDGTWQYSFELLNSKSLSR